MVQIAVGSGLRQPANPETDHDHRQTPPCGAYREGADADLLREMMTFLVNRMMDLDVESLTGTANDPTTERISDREWPWHTTLGTLPVANPKLRKGSYFPSLRLVGPPTRR